MAAPSDRHQDGAPVLTIAGGAYTLSVAQAAAAWATG
jgi:hypothetical protein